MEISQLLNEARNIWGDERLTLNRILVRLGVVYGDLCRWERDASKDADRHIETELKKELGNLIFSATRWCDDLGYDPDECINLAMESQRKFKQDNPKN